METQYLRFTGQGQLASLSYHELRTRTPVPKSATRGIVKDFSRKSRKRLLEQTARLDLETYLKDNRAIFITLTYGQSFPTPKTAKKHLFTLLKRFRRFAQDSSGIWRLEFQKRGAPHLHIILFNFPFFSKESLALAWKDIIGDDYCDMSTGLPTAPFTRIEAIKNARKAMGYVAKYCAKVEPETQFGFNDVPYLTASDNVGRVWGVYNRAKLPAASLIEIAIDLPREEAHKVLWQYRRLMAKVWKRANKSGRHKGASIFVSGINDWTRAFLWCLQEYCHDKSRLPHVSTYPKSDYCTMLAYDTAELIL